MKATAKRVNKARIFSVPSFDGAFNPTQVHIKLPEDGQPWVCAVTTATGTLSVEMGENLASQAFADAVLALHGVTSTGT